VWKLLVRQEEEEASSAQLYLHVFMSEGKAIVVQPLQISISRAINITLENDRIVGTFPLTHTMPL